MGAVLVLGQGQWDTGPCMVLWGPAAPPSQHLGQVGRRFQEPTVHIPGPPGGPTGRSAAPVLSVTQQARALGLQCGVGSETGCSSGRGQSQWG